MEGTMARWYDRQRGTDSQLRGYRKQAVELTAGLADGAAVLEVAPGPGYLAIEVARIGRFSVSGLDISRTFVEIERQHAAAAGVTVDFRQGDVAAMPFGSKSVDLIVCQAAFKNFRKPVSALNEMHRVLREGGLAIIQDMRKEATRSDIAREVRAQGQSGLNGWITTTVLGRLRRRAYSEAAFQRLVSESAFTKGDVRGAGIGLEVRLVRRAEAAQVSAVS
jgi:ubiquinone/menaquinone biosynthesis C-methylase UbiE